MIFPTNQTIHYTFAGIEFPHVLYSLPKFSDIRLSEYAKIQSLKESLIKRRQSRVGYYLLNPSPDASSTSFYLESDFMPSLRWKYADEVYNLGHNGWYSDRFQDQTIRGIVMQLNHGKGFLAGWTMGEGMISEIEYEIFDSEIDAARMADKHARIIAEKELESEEQE